MDLFRKRLFLIQVLILTMLTMGTFFLRSLDLNERPMHTDESVHAYKFGLLLEHGRYIYSASDYHGPTLYDATWLLARLRGVRTYASIPDESMLRVTTVLFGSAMIMLLLLMQDGLGVTRCVAAALFLAFSPALFYYSRYYIQEILFVFFTMGLAGGLWRYVRSQQAGWAVWVGLFAGLMMATKETGVLALTGLAGAAAWTRWRGGRSSTLFGRLNTRTLTHHWVLAVVVTGVAWGILLTHFMSYPEALGDYIRGLGWQWIRALSGGILPGSSDHAQPFYFYFARLFFWGQGPRAWWPHVVVLALALVGLADSLKLNRPLTRGRGFRHFVAAYAVIMTLIYSLIPYKTPWCALNFLWPMLIMAGCGAVGLFERASGKALKGLWCLAWFVLLFFLGRNIYLDNFIYAADQRTPYVYAHTSHDFKRLLRRLDDLSQVHPKGHGLFIQVILPENDYWPLPWYLRGYGCVGYWTELPAKYEAPVIISFSAFTQYSEIVLNEKYHWEYYGLRPDVLVCLSVRGDLWDAFMSQRCASEPLAQ